MVLFVWTIKRIQYEVTLVENEKIIDLSENGNGEFTLPSNDEKLFAMLIYVTSFFTTLIGSIIIWLVERDESTFVDYHGKEYLNFIISYAIYALISSVLIVVLIGFILLPIIGLAAFILTIIAAIKAYQGEMYRIPLIFRIIK